VSQLQDFAFVQVYMLAALAATVWMCAAFPVGALAGVRAGTITLVSGLVAFCVAVTGTTVWAVASGEWARFGKALGYPTLLEMGAFVALFMFTVYFMAGRYLADKRSAPTAREGSAADAAAAGGAKALDTTETRRDDA